MLTIGRTWLDGHFAMNSHFGHICQCVTSQCATNSGKWGIPEKNYTK